MGCPNRWVNGNFKRTMRRDPPRVRFASQYLLGRAYMAAAREQSARILRTDPDTVDDAHESAGGLDDPTRAHVTGETVVRRPAEMPVAPADEKPGTEKPAVTPAPVGSVPAKSGKRKLVAVG